MSTVKEVEALLRKTKKELREVKKDNEEKDFHIKFLNERLDKWAEKNAQLREEKLKITVNDLYEPLVNFWMNLQMFGVEMKDQLLDYKLTHNDPDSARELFNNSKDILGKTSESSIDRAVAFYIVNKCSFSGLTESSSFSPQSSRSNFSVRGIEKLP